MVTRVQGRWVTDGADGQPGDFWFMEGDKWLGFNCPDCGEPAVIPIRLSVEMTRKGWTWDGNREAPTLTPSIMRMSGCRWHGFLQGGVWVWA